MILGIYGTHGVGREVYDTWLDLQRAGNHEYTDVVFVDDFAKETSLRGKPVLPFTRFCQDYSPAYTRLVLCTGEPQGRKLLSEKTTDAGYHLATLVHPDARVGSGTILGEGVVLQCGSYLSCDVTLERNILVQHSAHIGHDAYIEMGTVISTGVFVGGRAHVGAYCYIGVGVPVREDVTIGSNTVVGMASAVTRNLPSDVVAFGSPARIIHHKDADYRVFR